jgi:hypothetical protein
MSTNTATVSWCAIPDTERIQVCLSLVDARLCYMRTIGESRRRMLDRLDGAIFVVAELLDGVSPDQVAEALDALDLAEEMDRAQTLARRLSNGRSDYVAEARRDAALRLDEILRRMEP